MAAINETNVFNYNNGFVDVLRGLNDASNGQIIIFILIGIFLMIFFLLRGYENKTVFISATTVTLLTSFLFWAGELISFGTLVVFFSLWLISLFFNQE